MYRHKILELKPKIKSQRLQREIWNYGEPTFKMYYGENGVPIKLQTIVVGPDFVARPDLIASLVYGDEEYTDLLCKLNGISNPFELNENDILLIPNINDIQKFYYHHTPEDSDINLTSSTRDSEGFERPTLKKKKDKRGPNEAIVGDKRFKVDPTRGIVIY